jgi:hypothetical protein
MFVYFSNFGKFWGSLVSLLGIKLKFQKNLYIIKEQAFERGAYSSHEHFGGGACVCHEHFGGGAYSCHNANTL